MHLTPLAGTAGITHVDGHARRIAGAVFVLQRRDVYREPLPLRRHPQLGIADANRRTAWIVERSGVGAPARA